MSHRVGPQSGDGVTTEPLVRLLGPGEIRALAGRLGVRPSKRLGQNFVVEQGTVRRIAVLAALRPDDVVLEVGPGLGSLTLALLEAGAGQLVAVEIDRALAGELPRTIAAHAPHLAGRTVVVTADALKIGEPGGSGGSGGSGHEANRCVIARMALSRSWPGGSGSLTGPRVRLGSRMVAVPVVVCVPRWLRALRVRSTAGRPPSAR